MASRKKTDLMRIAEEGLGGPLEETLQDALNNRGNAAALAKELGVAKGNMDYWIRRLGLELVGMYRRADQKVVLVPKTPDAGDGSPDSRYGDDDPDDAVSLEDGLLRHSISLSPAERALIDALREADVAIDDLGDDADIANLIAAALKLAAQGVSAAKIEPLTRSDVQMISHLKSIGAQRSDLLGITSETIACLREIEDKGLSLDDYAKFDMASLLGLQRAQRNWQRQGIDHDQVADVTQADLELLDAARNAGWSDPATMQRDLELLDAVREAGLDDPMKIEAVRRLREGSDAPNAQPLRLFNLSERQV